MLSPSCFILSKEDLFRMSVKRYLNLKSTWNIIVLILKQAIVKLGLTKFVNMDSSEKTKERAYEWCKQSIGGAWATIPIEDLDVSPISGGLTNYLYLCKLPDHVVVEDNVPRKVLLRLYGKIAQRKDYLIRNSVIFALFSEKKKGPKLYAMFPEGRLEEYLPTNALRRTQLSDVNLSRQIAQKLAFFHSLEMPLCKEPTFLDHQMHEWLVDAEKILKKLPPTDRYVKQLRSYSMREELEKLLKELAKVNSPVVFSHNDLQEGNLLYMEDATDEDKQITVIDWEYCSYNYRGFDFGNHFMEWSYDYAETKYPFYSETKEDFPSKEEQYTFFTEYLKEKKRLEGKDEEVTEEELSSLYKEANMCALASHFFWGLWGVVQKDISVIEFGFLEYAVTRLEGYFEKKKRNAEEGIWPDF